MRFPKRRADWRLGRWTAKCGLDHVVNARDGPMPALASVTAQKMLNEDGGQFNKFSRIEIRAAADGAPEVVVSGKRLPIALSISHRDAIGFCVIHPSRSSIGCDVELVEPRGEAFVDDYFTDHEKRMVASVSAVDWPLLETLIWSAKESALKMLRQGLRLDTRCVEASFPVGFEPGTSSADWLPLNVQYAKTGRSFQGWWRQHGDYVETIIVP